MEKGVLKMKNFLDQDFLLHNETAKTLYHEYAAKMPIIDFHNHLSAKEIYENQNFPSLADAWLREDHYKWRALRTLGIAEALVTGDGADVDKFAAWSKSMPYLFGNPLYHWTHLELQRYFDIHEPLSATTADDIYAKCNAMLQQDEYRPQGLLEMQQVQAMCTTDDPIDDLAYHRLIANDPNINIQVLPSFRPDKAVDIELSWFNDWVDTLAGVVGFGIEKLDDLLTALENRMDFFVDSGCVVSDNGIDVLLYTNKVTKTEAEAIFVKGRTGAALTTTEIEQYKGYMLKFLGEAYHARNWVMQLHIGALRNNNSRQMQAIGPNTGYDAVNNPFDIAKLGQFLDDLDSHGKLPKTIIYNLNPANNHNIVTLMQCFQDCVTPGKIQFGSGWWFMDQKDGMKNQLRDLMANGVLATFIGMLTDSRSFLSFPRHEYFRRILCQLIGEAVEAGEYPADIAFLGKIVQDISYNNAKTYFGFSF